MICESCGQEPATVHTTDIVNNVKTEKHLCETCYKKGGLGLPFSELTISELMTTMKTAPKLDVQLFKNLGSRSSESVTKMCEECGLTLDEFRARGAIACPHDYEVFADEIDGLLVKLHGERQHCGKFPKAFKARRARVHQVTQLESDLERAIDEERYEEAARLRDRIRALEEAGDDLDPSIPDHG